MRRGKAIRRVATVLPAILAPRMRDHSRCVAATRVGIAALRQLGVEAEPLPVHVSAYNPAFVQWMQEDRPGGPEEFERRGCYWLTTKLDPARPSRPSSRPPLVGEGWFGHLVALVPGEVPDLVDFDARQLARPEFGLHVPDVLIAPWGAWGTACESVDGAVLYEPLLTADGQPDRTYLTAKDWTREVPDIVEAVVRAAKG